MRNLLGTATKGKAQVLHCNWDPRRGYVLWITTPDYLGNPQTGGASIHIPADDVPEDLRPALDALCKAEAP